MIDILIIRGVVGVGKSSVGGTLATYFNDGVTIEIDKIREMINTVNWTNLNEYYDAIEITKDLLLQYLKFNYKPIVIIDTFNRQRVSMITDFLPLTKSYKIISLTASDHIIKERIKGRAKPFIIFKEATEVHYSDETINSENNFCLNTSELDLAETCNKILKQIV